jgi:nitrite reductase (NADH) large subunit
VLRDNQVAGAVSYGDTGIAGWLLDLMREKRDISAIRDGLLFGLDAVAKSAGEIRPAEAALENADGARMVA